MGRDEGYLISRTDQISVVPNSRTKAQKKSRLGVSRDEDYLISRTGRISVVRSSYTTVQNIELYRLCE